MPCHRMIMNMEQVHRTPTGVTGCLNYLIKHDIFCCQPAELCCILNCYLLVHEGIPLMEELYSSLLEQSIKGICFNLDINATQLLV